MSEAEVCLCCVALGCKWRLSQLNDSPAQGREPTTASYMPSADCVMACMPLMGRVGAKKDHPEPKTGGGSPLRFPLLQEIRMSGVGAHLRDEPETKVQGPQSKVKSTARSCTLMCLWSFRLGSGSAISLSDMVAAGML
ncbi:Hypothetical predicted protein [Podarcis lilfordi]|uniref:Uncharacterized protein n=1 Tax=Podarcis lilfordi TaxID=74358 RepID=A0AA35JPX8_9SAUR|nr:Hypothetical predicted protein [Podarcis lilfordi]